MKIIRPKPKCNGCGHWAVILHCISVMVNGCDTHWCALCWPDHSKIHDEEWEQMSEVDRDKIIKKYGG